MLQYLGVLKVIIALIYSLKIGMKKMIIVSF